MVSRIYKSVSADINQYPEQCSDLSSSHGLLSKNRLVSFDNVVDTVPEIEIYRINFARVRLSKSPPSPMKKLPPSVLGDQ